MGLYTTCKSCGTTRFLMTTDKYGLCPVCHDYYRIYLENIKVKLNDLLNTINNPAAPKDNQIRCLRLARNEVSALLELEEKGLPCGEPKPSVFIREIEKRIKLFEGDERETDCIVQDDTIGETLVRADHSNRETLAEKYNRLNREWEAKEMKNREDFVQQIKNYHGTPPALIEAQKHSKETDKILSTFCNRNNKGIEYEKKGMIKKAIEQYEKNVEDGYWGSHPYERLAIIYRRLKLYDDEIRIINAAIKAFTKHGYYREVDVFKIRLSKLKNKKSDNDSELKPSEINPQYASNPTLGNRLQMLKDSFPKFNFYYDMPEGMQTLEYLRFKNLVPFEKSVELGKYKEEIETMISKAKIAENENNYKMAIENYERLVVEAYDGTEPYERLMILYRKLKWFDHEKRIIQHAISFFSQLRENQLKNVLSLAKEFGMDNKALEYINSDKKIYYYGGAFELYNPYPKINRWKDRLLKIESINKNGAGKPI